MITIKIPINISKDDEDTILMYQKQYSNCLHIFYNRYKKGMSQKDCKHLKLNNLDLLDSWFRQSCIFEAMSLVGRFKDKKIVFGGKKNFFSRMRGLISKEEFAKNRLSPIYSIGENSNPGVKCNRKFLIQNESLIIFKPDKKTKISLKINASGKYLTYLKKLIEHQELRDLSITYKLSTKFIWISFDEKILKEKPFKKIKNRILAIDLNPNYIGYSILDWKNSENFSIIDKSVLSLKNLNDKDNSLKISSSDSRRIHLNNKRNFEVLQCSKFLIEKMKHYRCSILSIEDLNIKTSDKENGRKFNKLCNNQWCRNRLVNNLQKWCSIYEVELIKVNPEYSSFIGNLVNRNLKYPDMILSSIEISRRAYEFYHQYILKDKEKKKNIIWIEMTKKIKDQIIQSLEELNVDFSWKNLSDLYSQIKKSKCKYRVPLSLKESFSQKLLKYQLVFA